MKPLFQISLFGLFLLYKYQKKTNCCASWNACWQNGPNVRSYLHDVGARLVLQDDGLHWMTQSPPFRKKKPWRGPKMTCMTPGSSGETPTVPKSCSPCSIPRSPSPRAAFTPWPPQTASPRRFCHNRGWRRLSEACRGSPSWSSRFSSPHPRRWRGCRWSSVNLKKKKASKYNC